MSELPPTYVEGFHRKDCVLKMKYNKLGQTDLMVSRLSLGGAGFGGFYGEFEEDEAIETIREAIKCGINYIDTGPWYGEGKSESLIGKALKTVPRQAYYIATKVGRYEVNYKNMFNYTAKKTKSSFDDSLKRLEVDYVDVLQIHDVEFSPHINILLSETLPCVQEIKETGKAKYIGITGYPLSPMVEIIKSSNVKIDMILSYSRYTLIDDSLNDFIEFFKEQKVGIVCAAAHGMGLLTNGGPLPWHPAPEPVKEMCKEAGNFCQSNDVELGRLALYYAAKNHEVNTHLVGMNTKNLLHMNLDVMQNGITENEAKVLDEINKRFFFKASKIHWEGVELEKYKKKMSEISKISQ